MLNHQTLKNPQSCGFFNIESLALKERQLIQSTISTTTPCEKWQ
jgi:hypothetical protein